jgi:hypothetical protein
METLRRMAAESAAKTLWRMAKWKGWSSPMRATAAGLEAKDSITPSSTRAAAAPSSRWSVVHHHRPILDRSVRAKA